MSRDISMVVPKQILAGEIEDVIIQRGGKILESCQLFDIYEGAQIRSGFKSMAYSITFRAKDTHTGRGRHHSCDEEDMEWTGSSRNRDSCII